MPCVSASRDDIRAIAAQIEADPATSLTIDLEAGVIRAGDRSYPFTMREANRQSLIDGRWDPIADLLENLPAVDRTASGLPYLAAR